MRNYWLVLGLCSAISTNALAKDFALSTLLQAKNPTFDLHQVANKESYFDFVHRALGPKMQALAAQANRDNEGVLSSGGGVSVKLSQNNYNVHINFPNGPQGGRSYGWTSGQVGDWSDAMYLDHLAGVMVSRNEKDLSTLYGLLVEVLGACNADDRDMSIERLEKPTQRVAANFIAIYTAEEYRAMVPQGVKEWDDAIFEVTMLSAFHGGQSKFAKYYMGKFSASSKVQAAGVYNRGRPGPKFATAKDKPAQMNDYWQFSGDPTSNRSGIHLTEPDYKKMGQAITKYEATVARNPYLAKVQSIVGASPNAIEAISTYFTQGRAKDPSKTRELSAAVSGFLMNVHDDANKISDWIARGGNGN